MRVRLEARTFQAPMRVSFRHASADRRTSASVIVIARPAGTQDMALTGIGEGCPRRYVTGESVESAKAFIIRHRAELESSIDSLDSLRAWASAHEDEIDDNPAAFSALEGALLDHLARREENSLEALLGLPALHGPYRYSAVLGDSRPRVFWPQAWLYRMAGFADFKIKLSGDLDRDRAKLKVFKAMPGARLRADANNLWSDAESCIEFLQALDAPFWAIEEPVAVGDLTAQAVVAETLNVKIVLDESLLRLAQIADLGPLAAQAVANIRVSKCGGLLRSLALARAAEAAGIPLIFGAHVGETSVLTRAALCLSAAFGENVLAREGAFGRLLLSREPVTPTLRFGRAGLLDPIRFLATNHHGSGLTVL